MQASERALREGIQGYMTEACVRRAYAPWKGAGARPTSCPYAFVLSQDPVNTSLEFISVVRKHLAGGGDVGLPSQLHRSDSATSAGAAPQTGGAQAGAGADAHSMQDLNLLLMKLARREPFAFVQFGPADVLAAEHAAFAMPGEGGGNVAQSRLWARKILGEQSLSPRLRKVMTGTMEADRDGLFFGMPCALIWPEPRARAMTLMASSKHTSGTAATLFVNGNYPLARKLLPRLLEARQQDGSQVYMVVREGSDMKRFRDRVGIAVNTLRVPARDAFPAGYEKVRGAYRGLADGDVVIFCAGLVGRILATEWFLRRPKVTMLELGDFFKPELEPNGDVSNGRGAVQEDYWSDSSKARTMSCDTPGDYAARINQAQLMKVMEAHSMRGGKAGADALGVEPQMKAEPPQPTPNLHDATATMQDLETLLIKLARREPFMYAHFNDGEIIAVDRTDGTTDRGMQRLSPALSKAMRAALRTDRNNMYFGVPCAQEWPEAHSRALHIMADSRSTQTTVANLFVNGNYVQARRLLPRLLLARKSRVFMVVSANADMARFQTLTGLRPRVLRVPPRDAFPAGFKQLRGAWESLHDGDVVLMCAGPLGRVLAVEWFARRPKTTILELGSFFDPELQPDGRTLGATYYDENSSFRQASCARPGDVKAEVSEAKLMAAAARAAAAEHAAATKHEPAAEPERASVQGMRRWEDLQLEAMKQVRGETEAQRIQLFSCQDGQGARGGSVDESMKSLSQCMDWCKRTYLCSAIDWTDVAGPSQCRLYIPSVDQTPRHGDAGPHARRYCTKSTGEDGRANASAMSTSGVAFAAAAPAPTNALPSSVTAAAATDAVATTSISTAKTLVGGGHTQAQAHAAGPSGPRQAPDLQPLAPSATKQKPAAPSVDSPPQASTVTTPPNDIVFPAPSPFHQTTRSSGSAATASSPTAATTTEGSLVGTVLGNGLSFEARARDVSDHWEPAADPADATGAVAASPGVPRQHDELPTAVAAKGRDDPRAAAGVGDGRFAASSGSTRSVDSAIGKHN